MTGSVVVLCANLTSYFFGLPLKKGSEKRVSFGSKVCLIFIQFRFPIDISGMGPLYVSPDESSANEED